MSDRGKYSDLHRGLHHSLKGWNQITFYSLLVHHGQFPKLELDIKLFILPEFCPFWGKLSGKEFVLRAEWDIHIKLSASRVFCETEHQKDKKQKAFLWEKRLSYYCAIKPISMTATRCYGGEGSGCLNQKCSNKNLTKATLIQRGFTKVETREIKLLYCAPHLRENISDQARLNKMSQFNWNWKKNSVYKLLKIY